MRSSPRTPLLLAWHRHSRRDSAAIIEAIVPEHHRRAVAEAVVCAHCDHADGQGRTIAPGARDRPMPQRSNSAAVAAGTNWPGLCMAGLKQSSASGGETTEAVAKA